MGGSKEPSAVVKFTDDALINGSQREQLQGQTHTEGRVWSSCQFVFDTAADFRVLGMQERSMCWLRRTRVSLQLDQTLPSVSGPARLENSAQEKCSTHVTGHRVYSFLLYSWRCLRWRVASGCCDRISPDFLGENTSRSWRKSCHPSRMEVRTVSVIYVHELSWVPRVHNLGHCFTANMHVSAHKFPLQ